MMMKMLSALAPIGLFSVASAFSLAGRQTNLHSINQQKLQTALHATVSLQAPHGGTLVDLMETDDAKKEVRLSKL